MTRNEIISALYSDKQINKAISKMEPADLRDDLKQEMFLVLCKMDEAKLLDLYEKGGLKFHLIRTMLNMIKSDRSTFHNMFRKKFAEINPNLDHADDGNPDADELSKKVNQAISVITESERKILLEFYENDCNTLKMATAKKVSYKHLDRMVKNTQAYLRCKIRNATTL